MALLEIKNLNKSLGGKEILKDINFSAESGKIIGLLGPNGSGKTTLLKSIAGLLTIDDGGITIDGFPVGVESKKLVSFLPERSYLDASSTPLSLFDLFADFYEDFDRDYAMKMLENLQVSPTAKLKTLSKGMKEKVQLIAVTSRNAKLFLFDEPIGGVDPVSRDYILNAVKNRFSGGATVIISTHLIRDIEEVLDEYVFISNGRIIRQGETKDGYGEAETLDELFRETFKWF